MRRQKRNRVVPRVKSWCFRQLANPHKRYLSFRSRPIRKRPINLSVRGRTGDHRCSSLSLSRGGSLQKGRSTEGKWKRGVDHKGGHEVSGMPGCQRCQAERIVPCCWSIPTLKGDTRADEPKPALHGTPDSETGLMRNRRVGADG